MIKIENDLCIKTHNGKTNNSPSFKSSAGFGAGEKILDAFIKSQENLSSTRFIQDTATNWFPKAIFARSKADFAEMSFLEFLESAIFYFASPIIGEHVFRKGAFKAIQDKNIKEKVTNLVPKSIDAIKNNTALKDGLKKQTIATKAGIALACACIPIAEYNLSFAKNLFTLKTFKKSNFDNIANLDKKGHENEEQQKHVEEHSKKQLKKAAIYSAAALAGGLILAKFGAKSNKLQNFSETLLEPGKKISNALHKKGIKKEGLDKFLGDYLKFDFNEEKGKLALSKGQLALTAISGLFGYSKAAEDRGELDKKEVWTRVPLVVFYTIFGSALFDKGFKNILSKNNKFPDLIKKGANGKLQEVPKRVELPKIAENISKIKKTDAALELKRLIKEKAIITGVPYAFSLLFMGFSLSLITRLWTQYRYNKAHKNEQNLQNSKRELLKGVDKTAFQKFL